MAYKSQYIWQKNLYGFYPKCFPRKFPLNIEDSCSEEWNSLSEESDNSVVNDEHLDLFLT